MIFECINSIKEEIIEFDEEAESIEYLRASSNISAEANGSVNISRVLKWKGYFGARQNEDSTRELARSKE